MKLCITGAGGFIGSHLTESAVRAGHDVRALVRYNSRADAGLLNRLPADILKEVDVVPGDVCDPESVHALLNGIEGVLHLAALIGIPYSYVAPASYVETNVKGTVNLLNAARRQTVRAFIHTSTSEVYGTAQYVPIDEAHPLVGQSPYSASKIAADKIAESYALAFETPVLTIRPFNTYGPRQSQRAVIPTMAAQLLDPAVKTVEIGERGVTRDFTYVGDTVAAFLKAVALPAIPAGETLNLGTGEGVTIDEVYAILEELSGISKPVSTDPRRLRPAKSEVAKLVSSNERARSVLQWRPETPLREGLRNVIDYLRLFPPPDSSAYVI